MPTHTNAGRALVYVMTTAGIIAIGYLDYATGIEIRVFPLYFLPIAYASWHCGSRAANYTSFLAGLVWVAASFMGGRSYSHSYIWAVNFISQASVFLVVSRLVGRLSGSVEREQAMARTDVLTGLSNSRGFQDGALSVLALLHRQRRGVSLAYMDLNGFKQVNDTRGHAQGDAVLAVVGQVLAHGLRESDMAARLGGDEFVVLLPDTGLADAVATMEKLHRTLLDTPTFRDTGVTASIGVVSHASAPVDVEGMVLEADQAMYEAKASSETRVLARALDSKE